MCLGAAACGSTRPKPVAWRDVMRRWFADAAAQPSDPPFMHWAHEEEELFLRRIGYADAAVIGQVVSVGSYHHHREAKQVSFSLRPLKLLYGTIERELDENGELLLRLDHQDLDFQRALAIQRFLPGQRFLAFLKAKPLPADQEPAGWQASLWRPPARPLRVFHWALYRPEPALLAYTGRLYRLLDKKR